MKISQSIDVIFCDDIRREIEGKTSLIGVNNSNQIIVKRKFPVFLPKICLWLTVKTAADAPFKSLTLTLSGEPMEERIVSTDIPTDSNSFKPEGAVIKMLGLGLEMEYFEIHAPGIINAVVLADGEQYLAGRLRIKAAEGAEAGPTEP